MAKNETDEIWKDIPGYEGIYQASSLGRIRSLDRFCKGSRGYPRRAKGVVLKQSTGEIYPYVGVCKHNISQRINTHVLVLNTFVGQCPRGMECRHLDGNPLNACLSNLVWGTCKQNTEDKIRHGTFAVGEQCNHELTADKVRSIRKLYSRGWVQTRLAAKYKVSQGTISEIVLRKIWRHI